MADLERRHVRRARQRVVHQGAGHELARRVVDDLLVQGVADPVGDAAVDLPFDHQRVDHRAAVVDRDISENPNRAGLGLDLDDRGVGAVRVRRLRHVDVARGFEARIHRAGQRVARPGRGRDAGDVTERETARRRAAHGDAPVLESEILRRYLEVVRGDRNRLLADLRGRVSRRGAREHAHTAGERADPVGNARGVARDDGDLLEWGRQPIGDDLGRVDQDRKRAILAEIAKCELVCANCHAVRSQQRRGVAQPG